MPVQLVRYWPLALAAWLLLATPCAALQILTEQWPPMSFANHGKPDGMAVAIVNEILARHKDPTPIQMVPWARGIKTLTTQPDVLLFTVTLTPERKRLYTFIGPIAHTQSFLYSHRDSRIKIRTLDDARKVARIGVYAGTYMERTLRKRGFTNLDVSPDPQSAVRKLMHHRIDLWYESDLTAPRIMAQVGYPPTDLKPQLAIERNDVYLAFSRGTSPAVIRRWFATLRAMQQDGTLARIQRRWLPHKTFPTHLEITGLPPGTPMPVR